MPIERPSAARITLRAILSLAVVLVIMALALFLPAGRINWTRGWVFLASFVAMMAASSAYLWRTNPELLPARSAIHRGTKWWDKIIFALIELAIVAILLVAGFDGGRFHGSREPLWLTGVGYLLICVGTAIFLWAMSVNKFAEVSVRIQTERGHRVVETGPYAIVRHPFYVGILLWLAGVPLALGSFWAMIPAALTAVVMVVRTVLEDRTLQNELAGYKEYAARVRYRLIPGIW